MPVAQRGPVGKPREERERSAHRLDRPPPGGQQRSPRCSSREIAPWLTPGAPRAGLGELAGPALDALRVGGVPPGTAGGVRPPGREVARDPLGADLGLRGHLQGDSAPVGEHPVIQRRGTARHRDLAGEGPEQLGEGDRVGVAVAAPPVRERYRGRPRRAGRGMDAGQPGWSAGRRGEGRATRPAAGHPLAAAGGHVGAIFPPPASGPIVGSHAGN